MQKLPEAETTLPGQTNRTTRQMFIALLKTQHIRPLSRRIVHVNLSICCVWFDCSCNVVFAEQHRNTLMLLNSPDGST